MQSVEARERANYQAANRYSNYALCLTLAAIVYGLLVLCLAVGLTLGYIFHACVASKLILLCKVILTDSKSSSLVPRLWKRGYKSST